MFRVARYSLIMKDQTYLVLLKKASGEGKTMGRFLNDELDKLAVKEHIEEGPKLCRCGHKAVYIEHWENVSLDVCRVHLDKRGSKGWTEIELKC